LPVLTAWNRGKSTKKKREMQTFHKGTRAVKFGVEDGLKMSTIANNEHTKCCYLDHRSVQELDQHYTPRANELAPCCLL
jgi:hypothetical protein